MPPTVTYYPKQKRGNRFGIVCLVIAASLLVSGSVAIVRGFADQRFVAEIKNQGQIPTPNTQPVAGHYVEYALPTFIRIPAIGVASPLITVGKAADGTIDTPKGADFDKAAWYHDSPAPGQYGASVIVGHVDSYANNNGASVFYSLSKLKPDDLITIERADQTTAVFKVYATRQFKRNEIPTEQVYLPNTTGAELRLITCAGTFDRATDEYNSNAVIFAQLVSSHKVQ